MEYLLNAKQAKRYDAFTIEQIGIPSAVLMERAALAVTEELLRRWPDPGRVLVVCGSGNNGGDGFAVARLLHAHGCSVTALFAGKEESMSEECRIQRKICENCGVKIVSNYDGQEYTTIVDALLGIGLSRKPQGRYEELIAWINAQPAVRVCVDIPSGVQADTGKIPGIAVQADLTVTFACRKTGQLLYPGAQFCGELVCREIGIVLPWNMPERMADFAAQGADIPQIFTYGTEDLLRVPRRRPYSHKGSYGTVLLVAGSRGMSGAACLCAQAACRSGCGLVRVLTPECNRAALQMRMPEAIVDAYEEEGQAVELLLRALERVDVVGIGPGLGTGATARALLQCVLEHCQKPAVIDADGLNLLADGFLQTHLTGRNSGGCAPLILTPHPGELMRLTGKSKEEIFENLPETCRRFAQHWQVICVGKDARTAVSDGEQIFLNTSGTNGMAMGGSGDVLTGLICGLLAQGMEPFEAAALGVYLHGLAGEAAARRHGNYGMLSRELADCIGEVLQDAEKLSSSVSLEANVTVYGVPVNSNGTQASGR